MTIEVITRRFWMAVDQLVDLDAYLFLHDVSERSITHKLGNYLAPLFADFDVDCEYNRNFEDPKRILRYLPDNPEICEEVSVHPDIIIHRRGSNDDNLLIIEAKKVGCSGEEHDFDRRKIEAYARDPLNYLAGIRVVFDTGQQFQEGLICELYHRGGWITLPHP